MRHIIRSQQFSDSFINELLARARWHKARPFRQVRSPLNGKLIMSFFYAKSTRTRCSFEAAAHWLKMGVVSTENAAEFSSASVGETLEDSVDVLAGYGFSALILRHTIEGSGLAAAQRDVVSIVNAGDGSGQHPTQTALDEFTIDERQGRTHDLHVVFGGDLARGRTVRSGVYRLGKRPGNRFTFVSPPELKIGADILAYLKRHNVPYEWRPSLDGVHRTADVIYWTRVQSERKLTNGHKISPRRLAAIKKQYVITPKIADEMKKTAIIMHPLPRVWEIEKAVDKNPRAAYFEQAHNGLFIRMALLELVIDQHRQCNDLEYEQLAASLEDA